MAGAGATDARKSAEEQPALVLLDSGKTDNLFNMTGSNPPYEPSVAPIAFVPHEDYDLIWRLLQSGPVTLKANLQDTFSEKPAPASITVAEIKGVGAARRARHRWRTPRLVGPRARRARQRHRRDGRSGSGAHAEGAGMEAEAHHHVHVVHGRRAGRHRRRHLTSRTTQQNLPRLTLY